MMRKTPYFNVLTAGIPEARVVRDSVRLVDLGDSETGFTQYTASGERVKSIGAPSSHSAFGRIVRAHELLHAVKSTKHRHIPESTPDIRNAIEDSFLHARYWKESRQFRHLDRDARSVAIRDMRRIARMMDDAPEIDVGSPGIMRQMRARLLNHATLTLVRDVAVLRGSTDQMNTTLRQRNRARSARHRACRAIADYSRRHTGGNAMQSIIVEIVSLASRRQRAKAERLLARILLPEVDPSSIPDPRHGEIPYDDKKRGPHAGEGDAEGSEANPMRTIVLPMPDDCDADTDIDDRVRSSSGSRLNPHRFANLIATGSTSGLFFRTEYKQGGTILFDASGSMDVDTDTLLTVCKLAPAAAIAYYAGNGPDEDSDGYWGTLVIFAADGKRASDCKYVGGGNCVDLQALRWLLDQPEPRIFVTDEEFCSGPAGTTHATVALLATSIAAGLLTVIPTMADAHKQFSNGD